MANQEALKQDVRTTEVDLLRQARIFAGQIAKEKESNPSFLRQLEDPHSTPSCLFQSLGSSSEKVIAQFAKSNIEISSRAVRYEILACLCRALDSSTQRPHTIARVFASIIEHDKLMKAEMPILSPSEQDRILAVLRREVFDQVKKAVIVRSDTELTDQEWDEFGCSLDKEFAIDPDVEP
jgi:hypothetical protein